MADEAKRCERRDASGRRCVLVGWCEHDEWICTFSVPTDAERCADRFTGRRCLRRKHEATGIRCWYEGGGYRYATPAELAADVKPERAKADTACEAGREAEAWEWWRKAHPTASERNAFEAGFKWGADSRDAEVERLTGAGEEPTPEDAAALARQVGRACTFAAVSDLPGAVGVSYCSEPSYRARAYARTPAGWRRLGLTQAAPEPAVASEGALTELDVEFVRALEDYYGAPSADGAVAYIEAARRAVEAREASRG